MSVMTQAFLTSESQTWATPWCVIEALKPEFNFTLDVAAGPRSAKAPTFYTREDNAFTRDWALDAGDGDAWCNPPYGDKEFPVKDWVMRAYLFRARLNTVILLPANKTDQDWFHDLVLPYGEYRPVRGRIGFIDPETQESHGGNSQGSMLILFGPGFRPVPPKTFDYKRIRTMYATPGTQKGRE
jgi:phage N-6-adenine-methyltransferase